MLTPARIIGLFTEFILILLGALLLMIGVSGRFGVSPHTVALVVVGIALVYWGVRSSMRRAPKANRALIHVRSSSLILVGLSVLTIWIFPQQAGFLLAFGGVVLIVRGLLGAVLFLKRN
jgi:hypothetical protein